MALALRLAANQEEHNRQNQSFNRNSWNTRDNRPPIDSSSGHSGSSGPSPAAQPPSAQPRCDSDRSHRFQLILSSNAEKSERSQLGLCWHCPEKWVPGHVCKQKLLSYVGEEEMEETDNFEGLENQDDAVITDDLSHLHSLDRNSRARPFNVLGSIGTMSVCWWTRAVHTTSYIRVLQNNCSWP